MSTIISSNSSPREGRSELLCAPSRRRRDALFLRRLALLLLLLAAPGALAAQDDPDLPPGASDRIDKAEYLRLRAEHVATLRGLSAPVPAYARTRAIRSLEEQERAYSRLDPRIGTLPWTPIGPAPITSTCLPVGSASAILPAICSTSNNPVSATTRCQQQPGVSSVFPGRGGVRLWFSKTRCQFSFPW